MMDQTKEEDKIVTVKCLQNTPDHLQSAIRCRKQTAEKRKCRSVSEQVWNAVGEGSQWWWWQCTGVFFFFFMSQFFFSVICLTFTYPFTLRESLCWLYLHAFYLALMTRWVTLTQAAVHARSCPRRRSGIPNAALTQVADATLCKHDFRNAQETCRPKPSKYTCAGVFSAIQEISIETSPVPFDFAICLCLTSQTWIVQFGLCNISVCETTPSIGLLLFSSLTMETLPSFSNLLSHVNSV